MTNVFFVEQLPELLKELNFKKLVVVGGCFDLLHLGHIIFLQQAKAKGEILLVLLESDQTIKKLKGAMRPIHSQDVRAQILSELKSVDYVLKIPSFTSDKEYDELITRLNPSDFELTIEASAILYIILSMFPGASSPKYRTCLSISSFLHKLNIKFEYS